MFGTMPSMSTTQRPGGVNSTCMSMAIWTVSGPMGPSSDMGSILEANGVGGRPFETHLGIRRKPRPVTVLDEDFQRQRRRPVETIGGDSAGVGRLAHRGGHGVGARPRCFAGGEHG